MNKSKVVGRASPYHPLKKSSFLSLLLHRLLYSNIKDNADVFANFIFKNFNKRCTKNQVFH